MPRLGEGRNALRFSILHALAEGRPGPDHRQGGAYVARGFLSLCQGTGARRAAQALRLLANAFAKNARTRLLFKGEDFDKTDLRRAVR
jgi:hypothetical protein